MPHIRSVPSGPPMTPLHWLVWAIGFAVPAVVVGCLECLCLAPLPRRQAAWIATVSVVLCGLAPVAWLHIPPPWDRVVMAVPMAGMAAHAFLLSQRGHRYGLDLIAVGWGGAGLLWVALFAPYGPRRFLMAMSMALVFVPALQRLCWRSWRLPWSLVGRVNATADDTVVDHGYATQAATFRVLGDPAAAAYCDLWSAITLLNAGGNQELVAQALNRATNDARAVGNRTLLLRALSLLGTLLCVMERFDDARPIIAELQSLEGQMVLFIGPEHQRSGPFLAASCSDAPGHRAGEANRSS